MFFASIQESVHMYIFSKVVCDIYIMVINYMEGIYGVCNVSLPNTTEGERNDMVLVLGLGTLYLVLGLILIM